MAVCKDCERYNLCLVHCSESVLRNRGICEHFKNDWISVKAETPKEWKAADGTLINYLVYMPEYGVDVGNYLETAKTWVCMGLPVKVTHWMPLPEAPRED